MNQISVIKLFLQIKFSPSKYLNNYDDILKIEHKAMCPMQYDVCKVNKKQKYNVYIYIYIYIYVLC
jgi:hypothetical protein